MEPEPEPEVVPLSSLSSLPPIDLMPPLDVFGGGGGVTAQLAPAPPLGGGASSDHGMAGTHDDAELEQVNLESDQERQRRCGELALRTPEYLGVHKVNSDAEDPTRVGNLLLTVEMTEETGLGQGVLRAFHKPLAGRRRQAAAAAGGETIIVPLVTLGRDAADTYLLRHIAGHRVRVLTAVARKTDPTQVVLHSGGASAPLSPPQQGGADSASAVDVTVAIDKPLQLPPALAALPVGLPLPHLDHTSSRDIWLSTSSAASARWGCGTADDALELVLSANPYRVVQPPEGSGPSTNPELGSTGDPWLWRVELSLLRTGEHEAHASLSLGGAAGAAVNEAVVVGDYEIQVVERVAPLCTLDGAAARRQQQQHEGAEGAASMMQQQQLDESLVLTEYPLLIWHMRLQLRRLGDQESSNAEDAMWDSLTG